MTEENNERKSTLWWHQIHEGRCCLRENTMPMDWMVPLIEAAVNRTGYATDVDGLLEINGHILVIEQKCQGAQAPLGQKAALERLQNPKSVSLLYIWVERDARGWPDVSRVRRLLFQPPKTTGEPKRVGFTELCDLLAEWLHKANHDSIDDMRASRPRLPRPPAREHKPDSAPWGLEV